MRFDPDRHRIPVEPKTVSRYSRSLHLDRSPEDVLTFCMQAHGFQSILPFSVVPASDTDELIGKKGHVYPFKMGYGPAKVRWEAHIVEHLEDRFTDIMLKGPMRWWRHTHTCLPEGDGCLYTDNVEYRSYFGAKIDDTILRRVMERLFAYRHRQMKSLLEGEQV
jgi:ligand-binding SRPBCC domain-containing protein